MGRMKNILEVRSMKKHPRVVSFLGHFKFFLPCKQNLCDDTNVGALLSHKNFTSIAIGKLMYRRAIRCIKQSFPPKFSFRKFIHAFQPCIQDILKRLSTFREPSTFAAHSRVAWMTFPTLRCLKSCSCVAWKFFYLWMPK